MTNATDVTPERTASTGQDSQPVATLLLQGHAMILQAAGLFGDGGGHDLGENVQYERGASELICAAMGLPLEHAGAVRDEVHALARAPEAQGAVPPDLAQRVAEYRREVEGPVPKGDFDAYWRRYHQLVTLRRLESQLPQQGAPSYAKAVVAGAPRPRVQDLIDKAARLFGDGSGRQLGGNEEYERGACELICATVGLPMDQEQMQLRVHAQARAATPGARTQTQIESHDDEWEMLPSDLRTHLSAFRAAVEHMAQEDDPDAYWRHELRTIDRIEAKLAERDKPESPTEDLFPLCTKECGAYGSYCPCRDEATASKHLEVNTVG